MIGPNDVHAEPVTPQEAPPEHGRDLTLLALGIIVVNEVAFTAQIVATGADNVLVAQAGRLAIKAGLAYMTWQGFVWPRWMLVFLAGVAALTGPWALADAYRDAGATAWTIIMTAIVAGYFVATWLLAGSRPVSAFLRHRRALRDAEQQV